VLLRHRVALNGAELDELDGRIIIQSVRTDSGKTSMTGISLFRRDGQRLTNVQRDTIDVEIGFGLLIRKTDMAARAELLDIVNRWAYAAAKENGGAWLTVNYKVNRRMWVVLADPAEEGDLKDWANTFTITFRAYGVPYWQEISGQSYISNVGSSQFTIMDIGGSAQTVANIELHNESGQRIDTVTLRVGDSYMGFTGLGLDGNESLIIHHDNNGMLRIWIRNASNQFRSAMAQRAWSSADDLYVNPGKQTVGFSAQRACKMTVTVYGRYL
jgi:hypothetical protein